MMLIACDGGSSSPAAFDGTRSGESFLYVAPSDYYFGTKSVGSTTKQAIQIANRGADTYQLTSMQISGSLDDTDNLEYTPDEFAIPIVDSIELQPTQTVSVDVSFIPLTEQQKKANFVVNYDTIKQASDADNLNERRYYEGFDLEKEGQYIAARKSYSDYMAADPATSNKRRAAIKLPIIDESKVYGTGNDLELYLQAIDERDRGDYPAALASLQRFDTLYNDSYLADDALYLSGYIQLIDLDDSQAALRSMQTLRTEFPDSSYYDSSQYSEALAQIELGNDALATEILTDLRGRHTGLIAFGIAFAKDNLVSRLWFDRASQVLNEINTA